MLLTSHFYIPSKSFCNMNQATNARNGIAPSIGLQLPASLVPTCEVHTCRCIAVGGLASCPSRQLQHVQRVFGRQWCKEVAVAKLCQLSFQLLNLHPGVVWGGVFGRGG